MEKWFHQILESYPADSMKFFEGEKDRFNNPVGYTISRETKNIFNELLQDGDYNRLYTPLDNILKIRSVQDFTPSRAVAFIFLLKNVIREELFEEITNGHILQELREFEAKIDMLALLAFDVYSNCREKIYRIRVNEIKKGNYRLSGRTDPSSSKSKLNGELNDKNL